MSISDRILRRILARIERQAPVPQVDGLHGQHIVSLPAADWPYLIDAVTKLDDYRCAQAAPASPESFGVSQDEPISSSEPDWKSLALKYQEALKEIEGLDYGLCGRVAASVLTAVRGEEEGNSSSCAESTDARFSETATEAQRKSVGGGT